MKFIKDDGLTLGEFFLIAAILFSIYYAQTVESDSEIKSRKWYEYANKNGCVHIGQDSDGNIWRCRSGDKFFNDYGPKLED